MCAQPSSTLALYRTNPVSLPQGVGVHLSILSLSFLSMLGGRSIGEATDATDRPQSKEPVDDRCINTLFRNGGGAPMRGEGAEKLGRPIGILPTQAKIGAFVSGSHVLSCFLFRCFVDM